MARLKTRWNLDKGSRTHSDTASVISTNIWRIITEALLDMENTGFMPESNAQRLDILAEFAAYAIHLLDRTIYHSSVHLDRQKIVLQTAQHLEGIIVQNRLDVRRDTGGDSRAAAPSEAPLLSLLNQRSDEYAECRYDDSGPSFQMQRILGDHIAAIMPAKNRQWVATYILDIAAHDIYLNVSKALKAFLNT